MNPNLIVSLVCLSLMSLLTSARLVVAVKVWDEAYGDERNYQIAYMSLGLAFLVWVMNVTSLACVVVMTHHDWMTVS